VGACSPYCRFIARSAHLRAQSLNHPALIGRSRYAGTAGAQATRA